MGGFVLRGPTYTFRNSAFNNCRCVGYRGEIDQTIESFLLNKKIHILDLTELPTSIRDGMILCHLPVDMNYSVTQQVTLKMLQDQRLENIKMEQSKRMNDFC